MCESCEPKICTKDVQPGDVVYLERPPGAKDKAGTPLSDYGAGEYLVLHRGVGTLRVVKFTTGYNLHNVVTRALIGSDPWTVVSCAPGESETRDALAILKAFAIEGRSGKKQWIDSVYTDAAATEAKLLKIFTKRWPRAALSEPARNGCAKLYHDGITVSGEFFPCPPSMVPTFKHKFGSGN